MKLTRDYFKASNMTFRYGLTPIQLSVYCYLVSCAGSADDCFPSVKTIALYCNCSESSARKAVRRLDELGLIRCEAQYRENRYGAAEQTSNRYYILPPPRYFHNGEPVYEELP